MGKLTKLQAKMPQNGKTATQPQVTTWYCSVLNFFLYLRVPAEPWWSIEATKACPSPCPMASHNAHVRHNGAWECGYFIYMGCFALLVTVSFPPLNGSSSYLFSSFSSSCISPATTCNSICATILAHRRPFKHVYICPSCNPDWPTPTNVHCFCHPYPRPCPSLGLVCRSDIGLYESRRDSAQRIMHEWHSVSVLPNKEWCTSSHI